MEYALIARQQTRIDGDKGVLFFNPRQDAVDDTQITIVDHMLFECVDKSPIIAGQKSVL